MENVEDFIDQLIDEKGYSDLESNLEKTDPTSFAKKSYHAPFSVPRGFGIHIKARCKRFLRLPLAYTVRRLESDNDAIHKVHHLF